ncbi:MAG: hypothetical protein NC082_08015 [Clostridiales bacterium]|nr:hypothetical protein [Clostridiales bacterium]
MKILNILLLAVAALGLSSCLGDSSNSVKSDFSNYTMTYVSDNVTGDTRLTKGATYKLSNNYDNGTITISVGNLQLPNGTFVSFDIKDQRIRYNDKGGMILTLPSYATQSGSQSHSLTNVDFTYYNRYYNGAQYPIFTLSFNIDDRYSARVIYTPAVYWGTTTVTDQDGKIFTNEQLSTYYAVAFDPETRKANFGAYGAKFAENMPAMNMIFPSIPFSLNLSSYNLSASELTPQIGGTPYPNYKITDFSMTGTYDGTQYVSFTCTIDTEKLKGTYRVSAVLKIIPDTKPNTNN